LEKGYSWISHIDEDSRRIIGMIIDMLEIEINQLQHEARFKEEESTLDK
jgi:hypothetical protein